MSAFDENILKVIRSFSYEVFVVHLDKAVSCTCISMDTKQPSPSCGRCLGTGHKIKIRKAKVASQETTAPTTMRPTNEIMIARSYYCTTEVHLADGDIIVDDDGVYCVYKARLHRSLKGEKLYTKALCPPKKLDTKVFLKNFNKIIGR